MRIAKWVKQKRYRRQMKDNFGVSGRPHGGNASYVDEM